MIDLGLSFLLGLAVGFMLQEIHFRNLNRAIHDIEARMDAMERRLGREEGE